MDDDIDRAYREDLARNDAEYAALLANQPTLAQRIDWGLEDTERQAEPPMPEPSDEPLESKLTRVALGALWKSMGGQREAAAR